MARIKTLAFYFARLLQTPRYIPRASKKPRQHLITGPTWSYPTCTQPVRSEVLPALLPSRSSVAFRAPVLRSGRGALFPTETPGTSASSSSGYYGLGTCNFEFFEFLFFFISIIFLGKTGSPLPQVPRPLQHHLELPAIREPTGLSFAPKILLFALFPRRRRRPAAFRLGSTSHLPSFWVSLLVHNKATTLVANLASTLSPSLPYQGLANRTQISEQLPDSIFSLVKPNTFAVDTVAEQPIHNGQE